MCVTVPAARSILWRPGRHRTLRLPARSRTRPTCHSRGAPGLSQRPRLRHEDAPIPLPSSRRGPGSSSLPYPTPPHPTGQALEPPGPLSPLFPVRLVGRPPSLPLAVHTHAYRGAGASLNCGRGLLPARQLVPPQPYQNITFYSDP